MAIKIGPVIGVEGEKAFRAAFRDMIAQAQLFDNEMNKLTATFSKNDSALERNKRIQEQLTKQISAQKDVVDAHKQMLEKAQVAQQKRTEAYEKQKKVAEEVTKQYGAESEEAKKANKELEVAEKSMYRSQEVTKTWQMRLNDAEVELHNLVQRLKDLPNSLQVVGNAMQEQGEKIAGFGDKLTRYITTPLAGLGAASVKAASDFTDGMAKIYTISTETQKPMAEMAQELKDLSNATGYGLDDLTEAAYQAVSASVKTEDAVSFLTDATRLARGGFTDTTKAVDLLTTVINAYGYSAKDASYISDVLLKTQNDGKTIIDELAQSMGTVIPMAANYNVSLEQLAAAYATMTKQGVNTSRSTTFINAMFTELEKESSDVADILMNETGKSFAQLMADGNSLADVLRILYNSVGNDNEQFQRLFGNIRSGKAAAALVRDDFSVLTYEIERMSKATGQTDYALQMLETPGLKARRTLNRLKNTLVEIGETLMTEFMPIFEDVVDAIKRGTEWFANLGEGTQRTIVNIGLIVAALGPGLKIFGNVEKVLGKGISTLGKITKAMAGLPTPIEMIAAETEGATAASKGLFGLLELNGATVAGLAAAYVAVAAGAKLMQDMHIAELQSLYGLDAEEKALIQRQQEMKTAWEEQTKASHEEVTAVQANIDHINYLKDRYNELIDDSGKVKEGQEALANVIIEQLAEALGLEEEEVRKLIEANGKFGESIDEVIEKQRRQAIVNAYYDDYVKAQQDLATVQKERIDLTNKLAEQEKIASQTAEDLRKGQAELDRQLANGNITQEDYNIKMNELIQANSYAQAGLDQIQQAYDDNTSSLEQLNSTIDNYNNISTASKGSTEEFNLAVLKTQYAFKTAETGSRESLYAQYKYFEKTYNDMEEAVKNGSTDITEEQLAAYKQLYDDSYDELEKFGWMNKSQMAEASNQAKLGWQEKMPQLQAQIKLATDEGVRNLTNGVKKFFSPGSQSGEQYKSGISSQKSAVGSAAGGLKSTAQARAKGSLYNEGYNLATGYANGIRAGLGGVASAARSMAERAMAIVQSTQKSGSPSKITTQFGKDFGEGYVIGIKSMADLAREASAYLANNAIDTSAMINGYSPNSNGDYYNSTRTISAPISVNVSVNGNVDDYNALADVVADRIATEVVRKGAVFG